MKKIWIGIVIVGAAALFIGLNLYRSVQTSGGAEEAVQTVKLEEKEISSEVMVPGTLQFANEQYEYFEPEKGEIADIKVKEGDKVKKGDVLFTYTNEEIRLEKEQNALSIQSKDLQLEQVKRKISSLKSKEDELKAELGAEKAKRQIDEERSQLEMEEKSLQLELKQADLQKETLEKKSAALQVKSGIDGTVITVDKQAAAKQSDIQKPVIHIGNEDKLVVKGVLSEYDTLKVKKGQNVTITSDVIQNKEWRGRVSQVGLVPKEEASAGVAGTKEQAVQYPFEVKIKGERPKAKSGFNMILKIQTDKRIVQALPEDAVKQDGDQSYVFAVRDGKAKRINVKTGEKADGLVEITGGLTNKDPVIANPAEDMKSGTEVKLQ
ncbi:MULTISPECIES: efflux RND transporter periplasmic adaptor subunit [Bacillus]|uniref:Secretion protein, protein transporter n=1 Tax=Bacillus licheniformis (strain ATCC 14580 / DSM 13 / JCM 2505 / CCUG 7422 / NBRC 12200 / NCIMB 9375 / NCTC 10341 / NRRL NRS-1264 / Gibson 46) TaxID=279010 RepID=Q65K68_BACLD|nr:MULTISPECIES: efflux RND transporter periplasmic adaptor subunit [Bacillus]AAU23188.1 putative secretion protein, protein transporter [Bacillus licheniformis DSM 13 = ATCC 14580]AAU40546.1 antimicrobial peptide ABC exporter permease YknX [Bacillus licheniformis DSM 13 = ATCC 14580]MBG9695508.1 hemolysin D [Bacillus licheniformis]MDH3167943.1 efflux RND transporter periplasmic adaptor subunit [Bacillus licheniformis]NYV81340.1 efflux RND transporter periplasmic adaptor subunit [Bacillus sp. 